MSGKEQFYWERIANKVGSIINVDQFVRVLGGSDRADLLTDKSNSCFECIFHEHGAMGCIFRSLSFYILPGIFLFIFLLVLLGRTYLIHFHYIHRRLRRHKMIAGYNMVDKVVMFTVGIISGLLFLIIFYYANGLLSGMTYAFSSKSDFYLQSFNRILAANTNLLSAHLTLNASVVSSRQCLEDANVLLLAKSITRIATSIDTLWTPFLADYSRSHFPAMYPTPKIPA